MTRIALSHTVGVAAAGASDWHETVDPAILATEGFRGVAIWTPDRRLRVYLSSTLDELVEERRAVDRAVSALRLTPVKFEQGARPHPPRDVQRAYLAQSDIFIGLYWQSYGNVAPGAKLSEIEEDFDRAADKPRLLYIKTYQDAGARSRYPVD